MKIPLSFFWLYDAVLAASVVDDSNNASCEIQWVTIYTNAAFTSSAIASTVNGPSSTATSGTSMIAVGAQKKAAVTPASSISSSSAIAPGSASSSVASPASDASVGSVSTSTNPNGEPGFPVSGQHLSAPTAAISVPAGAATYTPPSSIFFSGKAFAAWVDTQTKAELPSKWLKVAPGVYNYAIDDIIAIGFTPGGWTLDLRGVTFLISVPNPDPTSGQAIYINQSEDFTILGGTIWFDQGEQWSQATVKSITPFDGLYATATFTVEQGYNASVWSTVGPRNQVCVDSSNPNHYSRPDCNFFYADQYDFSNLLSKKTFTSRITERAGLKVGYHITTIAGPNSPTTIASEFNGGLHVNGMTSNGGLAQYGLNGKVTATFENVWNVNPPARPGFAPRVQGPTLSQAHIGDFDFDAGGDAAVVYRDCYWQTSGSEMDLQDMGNQTVPS